MPMEQWPEVSTGRTLTARQEAVADILMALLKQQARSFDLSPGLLASRKEIERLACGKRDIPLMHGWRYEHGGAALAAFLDGEKTLQYRDNELLLA